MPVSKDCLDIFKKSSDSGILKYLDKNQSHQKFNLFIYINNEGRKRVLCSIKNEIDSAFQSVYANVREDDPFLIEKFLLVSSYGYQDTDGDIEHKIDSQFSLFKDIEYNISKIYYIGKYENTGPKNLDFAALKAIPEPSGDCEVDEVAFVIRFCEFLIDFSDMHKQKEKHDYIVQNIEKVKSQLRRGEKNDLSNWMSSILGASVRPSDILRGPWLIFLIIGVVVYPFLVAVVVKTWWSKWE